MKRKLFTSAVLASLIFLSFNFQLRGLHEANAEQKPPSILITEIAPTTGNADGYDFIELYNNSDQEISIKNYQLLYRSPQFGKKADVNWIFTEDKKIPAHGTIVVWIKNSNNRDATLEQFNAHYKTNLSENQITSVETNGTDGIKNSAVRVLVVSDIYNHELVSAKYVQEDIKENVGIQYKWSESNQTMEILKKDEGITPGKIINGQLSANQDFPPTITHEPITKIDAEEGIKFQAKVTDDIYVKNVTLSYHLNDQSEWTEVPMTIASDGNYTSQLNASQLLGKELTYKISAYDGTNTKSTDEYKAEIAHAPYNPQDVPYLLITEVVPDSSNVGSSDGYEYIEVYNNSDKTLNLKDYTIHYRYPLEGTAADLVLSLEKENLEIASGGTMVFWIINAENKLKTVADFNKNYGVHLIENKNITKLYSSGMANRSHHGVTIATNTGQDISAAYYNDHEANLDTAKDKGILYRFPTITGDNVMKKYSSKTDIGTPGTILPYQIPVEKVKLVEDNVPPIISDQSITEGITEHSDVKLNFDIQDSQTIKTARLYYKNNQETAFHFVDLKKDHKDSLYKYKIYSANLIGKDSLEYYLEASDGTNVFETTKKEIPISRDKIPEGLSLNVKDKSLLSKNVLLKALHSNNNRHTKLMLDNQDVTNNTTLTLPNQAYFAFDVKKVNLYFKNGITIGNKVLRIFDDTINDYATLTIPIDPKYFEKGKETKISIRSGTKVSPFDTTSEENRDDFFVKNIRLILSDGTVIYDPNYRNLTKEISVGDSSEMPPTLTAKFLVPEEKYTAKAYAWNTISAKDGEHIFTAVNGNESSKAEVLVDNTAPTVTSSVEEGKEYKGNFTIQAEAVDQHAGVQKVTATLDDKKIKLPLKTSSAVLSSGSHILKVKAIDQVGNTTTKAIKFKVVEEQPYEPQLIKPTDQTTVKSLSPKLKVRVSDPTNDRLDVSFYKGYQYKADQKDHMTIYTNRAEHEPPTAMTTAGEKKVKDIRKLTKADGKYITTTGKENYPYHRFEIKLDKAVNADDEIDINWEGKSIIGRKVSMYVWNYIANKWEVKEWKIAENSENFKLHASFKGKDYIKDNKVQVMVQDQIAATNQFDYSFIWMSDTQYYSKSYPYIFDTMTNWIAFQKEAMNIQYVFHTGDIVDSADQEYQWQNADQSMRVLDQANVPYGVLAGNHDVNHKAEDYTKFGEYFGENRFKDKYYYGASYKNNRGHYDLISEKGNDFIMLYMGWGISASDIAWLNAVLAKYPERKAILNFHEYLLVSGRRSPIGDEIYKKVIIPNKNVFAVLSGHYHDAETLIDEIDDDQDGTPDRKVYQMLADYQDGPEGGQGFMRILQVNPVENKIYVKTYSPYLNKFNFYNTTDYPSKDEFVIETDLTPKEKVVATDAINVNVFTNDKIGKVKNVKNENTATINWKHLKKGNSYSWYVNVTDRYKGKARSPIWSFETSNFFNPFRR